MIRLPVSGRTAPGRGFTEEPRPGNIFIRESVRQVIVKPFECPTKNENPKQS